MEVEVEEGRKEEGRREGGLNMFYYREFFKAFLDWDDLKDIKFHLMF